VLLHRRDQIGGLSQHNAEAGNEGVEDLGNLYIEPATPVDLTLGARNIGHLAVVNAPLAHLRCVSEQHLRGLLEGPEGGECRICQPC
jgi:hypothetical protein